MSTDSGVQKRLQLLVQSELDEFRRQLAHARNGRDRAVHKARKVLQRLRAIVRLIAPVDPAWAARENVSMRRLRRRLAPLRDAAARAETFRLLATRQHWKPHAAELRELAAVDATQHAQAWKDHPPQDPFWDSIQRAVEHLVARVQKWPIAEVDSGVLDIALARARKRLRRRIREAHGEVGRDLRHELRRKLRRYANMRRAAEQARDRHDERTDALLGLAKRCGHEGDLWLAICGARRAARDRPAFRPLIVELERARRAQCGRHDRQLQRMKWD